jgi:hypothetical protein
MFNVKFAWNVDGLYITMSEVVGLIYVGTSGDTRRYPGWEIAKADIWNRMEGQRLDRLDVICRIAIT